MRDKVAGSASAARLCARLAGRSTSRPLNSGYQASQVSVARTTRFRTDPLIWLLPLYAAASFWHFMHNAEYLADYPNLPAWLSRADVYVAWCTITGVGALGYVLYRLKAPRVGMLIIALYAGTGFDGLLHYARAPVSHHTMTMNLTIWSEAVAAALLLTGVATVAVRLRDSVTPNTRWSGP